MQSENNSESQSFDVRLASAKPIEVSQLGLLSIGLAKQNCTLDFSAVDSIEKSISFSLHSLL